MSNVRVSVIMPIHNEEKYLSYAIDSILAQTYAAWELIVVNDASTDRSEAIVKSYSDPRIRYFTYEKNKGTPFALNLGMRESKGEYIIVLAGDDVAYPNMLACQAEYLDSHPECIHVQGALDRIDADGKITQRKIASRYKSDLEIRAGMLYCNCATGGGSMYRRTAIDEYDLWYDLEAIVSQDFLFWINMLPYGEFACIDETVFQYRNAYRSNSHRIKEHNREWYDSFMRKIFMHAWTSRGYDLNEADIKFIHKFLYQKKLVWKLKDIKQGIASYKKINQQSKTLDLKEKNLILRFFIEEWIRIYKRYLMYNRFTAIFRKNDVVRRDR